MPENRAAQEKQRPSEVHTAVAPVKLFGCFAGLIFRKHPALSWIYVPWKFPRVHLNMQAWGLRWGVRARK